MGIERVMGAEFFLRTLIGSSLILAGGILAIELLRGQSAATKHLVGTFSIVSLLILPVLLALLPSWKLDWIKLSASPATPGSIARTSNTSLSNGGMLSDENKISLPEESLSHAENNRSELINTSPRAGETFTKTESWNKENTSTRITTLRSLAVLRWDRFFLCCYFTGCLLGFLRMLIDYGSIQRIVKESTKVTETHWTQPLQKCCDAYSLKRSVECRLNDHLSVPMVAGILSPVVLLPSSTSNWPQERLTSAIAHELAHVQRNDLFFQWVLRIVGIFYWPQPLLYCLVNIIRREREIACDDLVIGRIHKPAEYAKHLFAVAVELSQSHDRCRGAIAMARCSNVEQRIQAILSPARRRGPPPHKSFVAMVACSIAVLFTLSVFNPISNATLPQVVAGEVTLSRRPSVNASEKEIEKLNSNSEPKSEVFLIGRILLGGQPVSGVTLVASRVVFEGVPQSLAKVRPDLRSSRSAEVSQSRSDENGNYRLTGLKTGDSYKIDVKTPFPATDPTWNNLRFIPNKLQEEAHGEVALPDMHLRRLTQSLAGRVVDLDGKPIVGAGVIAQLRNGSHIISSPSPQPPSIDTDKQGRFYLKELPDEPLAVFAYVKPQAGRSIQFPTKQNVELNQQDIRIVLDPSLLEEPE